MCRVIQFFKKIAKLSKKTRCIYNDQRYILEASCSSVKYFLILLYVINLQRSDSFWFHLQLWNNLIDWLLTKIDFLIAPEIPSRLPHLFRVSVPLVASALCHVLPPTVANLTVAQIVLWIPSNLQGWNSVSSRMLMLRFATIWSRFILIPNDDLNYFHSFMERFLTVILGWLSGWLALFKLLLSAYRWAVSKLAQI